MDSSPAQHVVSPINFDTVQPARERRPSYRQSYEDWRSGEGSSSVKGEVHGIRVATYISGALATPHGSAAQFRRVSSVNLLAKSLEHANELYDELESLESKLKVTSLLGGCLCVAAFASFLNGYHTSVMIQGRKRVIQRRFNVSVPRARVSETAPTLRERSER